MNETTIIQAPNSASQGAKVTVPKLSGQGTSKVFLFNKKRTRHSSQ